MRRHPVADLERQRCDALVAGDLAGVSALLAPDLVYVHAPGIVHDRDALMHFLRMQIRFSAVERRGVRVRAARDTAWTTGWMRIAGHRQPGGEAVAGVSFVTQVWRRAGGAWQMALFQSTRVDDAAWPAEPPPPARP